jgi:hypothetical protein
MGLDSVELIVEWENYFNIEIPNAVAEKISTVQDAVNAIAALRNITRESTLLRENVFQKMQLAAIGFLPSGQTIKLSDLVTQIFPDNTKENWQLLEEQLQLEVPNPPMTRKTKSEGNILNRLAWTPDFDFEQLTFSQLTDVICGANYKALINPKAIVSQYEIYIAIMGITVDKIGIDFYEYAPEKTFCGDFGID